MELQSRGHSALKITWFFFFNLVMCLHNDFQFETVKLYIKKKKIIQHYNLNIVLEYKGNQVFF